MNIQRMNDAYDYAARQKQKRKKKLKKRLARIKFLVLLLLAATTVVLLALSPLFNIKRIDVQGNVHYSKEDILPLTGLYLESNAFKSMGANLKELFTFRYGPAEKNIADHCPYVKSVRVQYSIPGKVTVYLEERTPACVIPCMGANLLVDSEGYVLDIAGEQELKTLPLVKGLVSERYSLGQALPVDRPEGFQAALKVVRALEDSDREESVRMLDLLTYIDAGDVRKIRLLLDSRIHVNLGDLQDLKYRINFLRQVYTKNIRKDEKGTLDFTNGENPSFVPEK